MSWAYEAIEVSYSVDGQTVLDRVAFGAPMGAVTAVVGPTGAGKTALVRLVTGLDRPGAGALLVGGKDIARARAGALRRLRRKMGVAFQAGDNYGYGLFGSATAHQNLVLSMEANGRVPARRIALVAGEYLEAAGLAAVAGARPQELSRDQRKRLALMRALALRAPFAVIDDLDGDLDPHRLDAVCSLVRAECERQATSCLITTRNGDVAARVADHCVVLEHGAVVEEAPATRLRRPVPAAP